jgi:catechol 2,3-dioxygenase-like lactoylglutathione lyase family enzyme
MLHHVSVGVRDVERAAAFYDTILGTLGYKRVMEFLPYAVAYGDENPEFWVQLPHNQQVATAGNGVHISFIARTQAQVDQFHAAAVELGAQDAGAPGPRPDYGPDYYGAFIIDGDGNKLEATLLPLPKKRAAKPAKKKAKAVKKTAKNAVPVKKAPVKKAAKPVAKKAAKKAAKKPIKKPAPVKKNKAKKSKKAKRR